MKKKLTISDASQYGWDGINAYNFQFPDINDGMSVVVVETTGEHGEVENKDRKRIYYMLQGEAEFTIEDDKFLVHEGEIAVIPEHKKYNYYPKTKTVKTLLIMELNEK